MATSTSKQGYEIPAGQREADGSSLSLFKSTSQHLVKLGPGLILVIIIGWAAYLISQLHSSLDALAMAIILGISIRMMLGKADWFLPGAQLGVKVFIPVGIILYGVNLDFSRVINLPLRAVVFTALCMLIFYLAIYWLNIIWKLPTRLSELIASGSAICGASAIAVLSPSIDAEPEDTSVSLLVITAIGLLGVMVYPLIKIVLGMDDTVYAMFSGATLHQTGLVRITIASLGEDIAAFGLAVKTLRIAMLAPIAVFTGLLHARRRTTGISKESRFNPSALKRVWFLLPFVLMGLLISFFPAARSTLGTLKVWATLLFSVALASIGFIVEIESVLEVGIKPLIVGLLGWICVIIFFLLVSPVMV